MVIKNAVLTRTKVLFIYRHLFVILFLVNLPMEDKMAWSAPKLKEINCGMEINMYSPSEDEGRDYERDLF